MGRSQRIKGKPHWKKFNGPSLRPVATDEFIFSAPRKMDVRLHRQHDETEQLGVRNPRAQPTIFIDDAGPNKEHSRNMHLIPIKLISSGGYGRVWLYVDAWNKNKEYAIKIEDHTRPWEPHGGHEEKWVLEKQRRRGMYGRVPPPLEACGMMKAAYLTTDDNNGTVYYIMEYMPVSLLTLLREDALSADDFLRIVEEIRKQLVCLADHGMYHTDVKAANILLRRRADGTVFSPQLADFGSITMQEHNFELEHKEFTSTYRAPEVDEKNREEFADADRKGLLSWQIGVLLCEFAVKDTLLPITPFIKGLSTLDGEYLEHFNQTYADLSPALLAPDISEDRALLATYVSENPAKRPPITRPLTRYRDKRRLREARRNHAFLVGL